MPLSGFGLSMYTKIRELMYRIKTHVPVTNAPVRQLLVPAQDAGRWVRVLEKAEKSWTG